MIFKLLIDPDYEKAVTSAKTIRSYGIDITDERIAPVRSKSGTIVMEPRVFICEGSEEQLKKLCKDQGIEFRQEYEGAPLYY